MLETDQASPFTNVAIPNPQTNIEISDEDKINFYKCFLKDESYTETFSLFDGSFKVTFRTITVKEQNDIFSQLTFDYEKGLAKNDNAYMIRLTLYRLGISLVKINGEDIVYPNDVEDLKDLYVKTRIKYFENWNSFKLSAVLEKWQYFDSKVFTLLSKVQDKDFWKAVK